MTTFAKQPTACPMLAAMMRDIVCELHGRSLYADWLEDNGRDPLPWRESAERIEALTPAQEALFPVWRDYWRAVGLRTTSDPLDIPAIKAVAAEVYREAGLPPPRIVVQLGSPFAGALAAVLLPTILPPQASAQVRAQVRDQVSDQVCDQGSAQVRAQVSAQVTAQVTAQVSAQVIDQVRAQVIDQVSDQGSAQVSAQVIDHVGDQAYRAAYGLHDAGWLSFYSFLRSGCGLTAARRLLPLIRLAHLVGWWWSFAGAVVLTPLPSVLKWRGKKLVGFEYPDGFRWSAP